MHTRSSRLPPPALPKRSRTNCRSRQNPPPLNCIEYRRAKSALRSCAALPIDFARALAPVLKQGHLFVEAELGRIP